jgi:hypothetical protein
MSLSHITWPTLATLCYIESPAWIPRTNLRVVAVLHNTALTVYSGYMFYTLTYELMSKGIVYEHRYYFQFPAIQTALWSVYLSKYYEFGDTFLLYAAGKTPIFLQKFHHIGAVYIWHLANIHECDFIFYVSWLNCGVHTIMYSYYLASLFTKKIPKAIKQSITTLQIGQLATGVMVLPYQYYFTETRENYDVLLLFSAYVMALLWLFGEFMYRTY